MSGLMIKLYIKPLLDRRWKGRRGGRGGAAKKALQLPPITTETAHPPDREREQEREREAEPAGV
jgi:hypothetical protein